MTSLNQILPNTDRVQLVLDLAAALRAKHPGDAAWSKIAQKAAQAWVASRVTGFYTSGGTPKNKTKRDILIDYAVWDQMRLILQDWPLYPIGAGTGAADAFFIDAAKALGYEVM